MGLNEKVLGRIAIMEQRVDERRALWQAIMDSFQREGPDSVTSELARQMNSIGVKLDTLLDKLKDML